MAQNIPVILARDVANLGRLGELVNVRPGYARNFLLPQGLALPASQKRVAQFDHQKRLIEHKRRLLRTESEKRAKSMSDLQITLTARVGEQGKMFGAITARDISKGLAAIGQTVHHKDIKLAEQIKTLGLHPVEIRLEGDVSATIKVVVAPEKVESSAPQAEEKQKEAAPEASPATAQTATA